MKSIGQMLSSTRVKKGLSVEDVTKHTKIHPRFVIALEKDDYSVFEGKVHSKGFLKVYADFLGLNGEEILALWRREYAPFFPDKPLKSPKSSVPAIYNEFVITPGLIGVFLVLIFVVGFFGFLYSRYSKYTEAPNLEIYFPSDNYSTDEDIVDISGKTDLDSKVFINTQEIQTDPTGNFVTSIKLREGVNTISIKSVNKLDKSSEVYRNIVFRPKILGQPIFITPETSPSQNLPID